MMKQLIALCVAISCCTVAPLRAATPAPAKPVASPPCRLLLDNDDGISAPGIHALYDMLKDICTLVVVAPSGQQSGMSHAVPNVSNGLKVRTVAFEEGVTGYAVDGTPAEAACLGVIALSDGKPFDLVVLGINEGENTGLGNLYSGTINGGMETLVRGTPAVAFSLSDDYGENYAKAAPVVRAIVREALAKRLPPGVMLNVNIPKDYTGIAVLPSRGLSVLIDSFTPSQMPNGETLYTPNMRANASPPPGGDVAGYMAGEITITPLAMDRTATATMTNLKDWSKAIHP